MADKKFKVVKQRLTKIDSLGLACGRPAYVDDIKFDDMLYAKILTSPYAHAKILSIDVSAAEKLDGVECVLTYKNVPRVPHTTAGQGYPEPSPYDTYVLDNKVRYVGDRVAAVAASTPELAEQAIKLIKVKYKVLDPILNPKEAMKKGAPVIHDEKDAKVIIPIEYDKKRNMAAHADFEVGNIEKGLKKSDYSFEYEYESHYAQHCPTEPHQTVTYLDRTGRLVIRTSTQVPFHVRRIVSQALEIPVKNIRVIKPRIGGGFGTKQEILLEDICSLLTLRTEKPVKLIYNRKEEFVSSRTRHPQVIKLRTGIDKDGSFNAIDLEILMNTGAYGSHALTVACNSGSKVLPLFNKVPNVRFDATTVYTNMPVGGAYRGYGATQAYFALGVQIDEMCEKIGMDVIDFYRKHHIQEGESSPVFEALGEGKPGVKMTVDCVGFRKCLDMGEKLSGWKQKRNKKRVEGNWHYGIGMVGLMQGSSIPEIDMAAVTIKINDDGSFNLLCGATDLGTGSDTVLAQIAAETIGTKLEDVIVYSSDTDLTPFDVGAYASSTTYLSGAASHKAALKVREQILDVAAEMLKTKKSNLTIENAVVKMKNGKKSVSFKDIAYYSLYESNQFQICATDSAISHKSPPPFSAQFAEVAVDITTGQVKLEKFVAIVDCGTPINPTLAEGQVEGGVMNGISFALTEEYIFDKKGKMLNPNFGDYKLFYTQDMPEMVCKVLMDSFEPTHPYGAKSVSEIGINGGLPAISNAIYNAVGVRLRQGPFTSERVYNALKNK